MNFMTYEKAKYWREYLSTYISLIEEYDEHQSIDKWIIKNYALTNSISKVIKNFNASNLHFNDERITREYIIEVIRSKPTDELHKIVRSGYIKKIRKKRD